MYRSDVIRSLFTADPMNIRLLLLFAFAQLAISSPIGASKGDWTATDARTLASVDDDIARNIAVEGYFADLNISEYRFSENGFAWHLIRFSSATRPDGPVWVVPHDDENAAFEGMMAALRQYGGTAIVVNSGPGSARRQAGAGQCGVRDARVNMCDPNRNFADRTPIFTRAFLEQFSANWPVIALHTNSHGFSGDGEGGRGDITILDRTAHAAGKIEPRRNGLLAVKPQPIMANADTFALSAFLARDRRPSTEAQKCGARMAASGVHFWHEEVYESDGSLSNYLAINRREIAYVNVESRVEDDLSLAAKRQEIMIAAYLANCVGSRNEPAAVP
jgi:hypothetical protein